MVFLCVTLSLCVSTVKKAKLDGPQGKTWHPGIGKKETCWHLTLIFNQTADTLHAAAINDIEGMGSQSLCKIQYLYLTGTAKYYFSKCGHISL